MEAAHEILSSNYKETSWVFAMNFSKQKNKASEAKQQIDTLEKDLDCAQSELSKSEDSLWKAINTKKI